MSLFYKKCGCGATVHRSAEKCPSCGKPKFKVPQFFIKNGLLIVIFFGILIFYSK
ncbi:MULTISPECIES: hypothetical protein [unclassified Sulfurimonas]|uniref:hypothetical protein n=1 Tax=unclassified Sulfurimonas TaxID=2623549 RepID=UPI0025CC7BEF|nr:MULTISPECIES: hypothetical protein [unclassified Sulfurimonas]